MKSSVCMCLYKRESNLPKIIEALEQQTFKDFDFNIWYNNSGNIEWIKKQIDKSNINGKVFSTGKNEGSKARFWLVHKCKGNPIIFFDDDQIPKPNFIEYLYNEWIKEPDTVKGHHNRIFMAETYWNNVNNGKIGGEVDYVGTGGMVLDRKIVEDERLQNIVEICSSVEDLYLCFVAKQLGYRIVQIKKQLSFIEDNLNQFRSLKNQKQKCFEYIRKQGFKLVRETNE